MNNQSPKPKKRTSSKIVFLIVAVYLIISLLPTVIVFVRENIQGSPDSDDSTSSISFGNLELNSVDVTNLSETDEWKNGSLQASIPELKEVELKPGYQVYRFDVEVNNTGSRDLRYDGSVFLGTDEGDALQATYSPAEGSREKDTRFIPIGREAMVTVYGQVSDETNTVYLKTYATDEGTSRTIDVDLSEVRKKE